MLGAKINIACKIQWLVSRYKIFKQIWNVMYSHAKQIDKNCDEMLCTRKT